MPKYINVTLDFPKNEYIRHDDSLHKNGLNLATNTLFMLLTTDLCESTQFFWEKNKLIKSKHINPPLSSGLISHESKYVLSIMSGSSHYIVWDLIVWDFIAISKGWSRWFKVYWCNIKWKKNLQLLLHQFLEWNNKFLIGYILKVYKWFLMQINSFEWQFHP